MRKPFWELALAQDAPLPHSAPGRVYGRDASVNTAWRRMRKRRTSNSGVVRLQRSERGHPEEIRT